MFERFFQSDRQLLMLQQEIAKLKNTLRKERKSHKDVVQELEEQVSNLEEDLQESQRKNQEDEKEVLRLSESLNKVQKDYSKSESELSIKRQEVDQLLDIMERNTARIRAETAAAAGNLPPEVQ